MFFGTQHSTTITHGQASDIGNLTTGVQELAVFVDGAVIEAFLGGRVITPLVTPDPAAGMPDDRVSHAPWIAPCRASYMGYIYTTLFDPASLGVSGVTWVTP